MTYGRLETAGAFRSGDIMARIGGDEFAALLPGAGVQEAEEALARVWRRLAAITVPGGLTLSLAIGWAVAESPVLIETALRQADERMYDHKKSKERGNAATATEVPLSVF